MFKTIQIVESIKRIYREQRENKSLSVVLGFNPRMYKLVLLNCSAIEAFPFPLTFVTEELTAELEPELEAELDADPEVACEDPPVLAVETGGEDAGIRFV